jgi:uncharacterized protein
LKFLPDSLAGVNTITRHDPGRVTVGDTPFSHSVIVPWVGEVLDWQAGDFNALQAAHFERLAALQPELVIFGSGARQRFVPPALLRALIERRIGIECMDSAAACRTYNVLVSEKRSVVAALLVERPGPG